MSTYEERREDAKRDAYYDKLREAMPDSCTCEGGEWQCVGTDPAYGADADGRRGRMLSEWTCSGCGRVQALVGD